MGTVVIWLIYIKLVLQSEMWGEGLEDDAHKIDLSPIDLKKLRRACPKIYGELKTSTEYSIDFMSLYRC